MGAAPGRLVAVVAVVAVLAAGATACDNDGQLTASPSGTIATPTGTGSAVPSPDEQALLLSQYRRFWTTLAPVSRMPPEMRRSELGNVAVDPALKSLLDGMLETDAKGQVFYGADIPRATMARLSPDQMTGVVDDCQDSTKTGLAEKSTMKPVTVGVDRNHVVVTMKKQPDGIWKVAFVSYSETPC